MNKTVKIVFGIFAAFILLTGSFAGGFVTRHALAQTSLFPGFSESPAHPDVEFSAPPTLVPPNSEQTQATPGELENLFVPFWDAWNLVHERFVDQPVDDVALMQGAIRGMLESLGEAHTFYMDPKVFENESSSLSGEYQGIGAQVDTSGAYLTIISPFEGSPAQAAGLQPGDMIIAIDGEDMSNYSPEEARQRVLGPEGTKVVLTVAREGESEPKDYSIIRAVISVASVTGEMLENDIAYIDINSFGDNTTGELRQKLDELLAQNPKGIIVDLRFNPGGYLVTAVEVMSEFVDNGVVLIEQYGDGTRDTYNALGNGKATDIPMVVLINEGSASASEIFAGTMQDYGRAKLVGVQSYGKGSVQIRQPLSNDQGAASITIAKWLTPKERGIDGIGLTPDVIVEMTEDDYANNLDPQLDAAVETLNALLDNTAIPTSQPIPATATPSPQ
ncbi:MAG TPA: S41 family peptidase [Anaerolineales bacterium]|nr:S41 family peptidase [Anaerolineales bacterium]